VALSLEAVDGPPRGQKIQIRSGQTITVGRTSAAMRAFGEDEWMSSLHFSLSLAGGSLHLHNLSKTNGTLVNGSRIEAPLVLKPGDRVQAGRTTFAVLDPLPNPYPPRARRFPATSGRR
jgi:predicted component of type VI protein secretion system